MRIALLSDLHGNEFALEAVLADVADQGVDQIVCLGDVVTLGPRPQAVLARLRDLGCPCILGNHDAFMLDPSLIRSYTTAPAILDAVDWCRSQLTESELRFISLFSPSVELVLEGATRMLLFHGSPRSHTEGILCTTAPELLDTMLANHDAAIMAGGHTHIQMLRQHRGMLLVNPGSVGQPFERYVAGSVPTLLPQAEWACVSAKSGKVSVSLHRIPLDRHALRAAVTAVQHPLREWLSAQYS